ncbi:MAG: efflux RND transporter periplasmic adaptor subunit [Schleiferiaceae bacterium]|nr:efflux RND transporter periplasmic adaptor subunit [Schleiferiaceae bacterium]
MKKVLLIAPLAFMAACSQPAVEGDLQTLSWKRDSTKNVVDALNEQIALYDAAIAALDTSATYDVVTTYEVNPAMFSHYFEVFGKVEADKSINLYPLNSGKVERIHVKEGQKVSQGQLLVSLDTDLMESSIKELETAISLAKTVFTKQQRLWIDEQIGSEIQYLQAKNNYDGLVQKRQTLKEQKSMSEVRAPFAGTIDEVFTKEGELAAPQMPTIRLVNTSSVYIKADVPESYSNRVKVGTPANVAFTSMDYEVASEVLQVGQFIQEGNRTFSINVSLPEADDVKPNQMVHVALQDYKNETALSVPSSLVQQDVEGNDFVFALNKMGAYSEVSKVFVEAGLTYEGRTEIKSGIEVGAQLVDKGSRSVRTGQRVHVK